MHTPSAAELDPCIPLLMSVALVGLVGLIVWAVRKPKGVIGRRMGQVVYGRSLEWPTAFSAAIAAVGIHVLLSHNAKYLLVLRENRESLGNAGVFLFLTVGALAFSKVREQRALRIVCLVAASLGLCMACAFKLA
jgi:hypothetical protein